MTNISQVLVGNRKKELFSVLHNSLSSQLQLCSTSASFWASCRKSSLYVGCCSYHSRGERGQEVTHFCSYFISLNNHIANLLSMRQRSINPSQFRAANVLNNSPLSLLMTIGVQLGIETEDLEMNTSSFMNFIRDFLRVRTVFEGLLDILD